MTNGRNPRRGGSDSPGKGKQRPGRPEAGAARGGTPKGGPKGPRTAPGPGSQRPARSPGRSRGPAGDGFDDPTRGDSGRGESKGDRGRRGERPTIRPPRPPRYGLGGVQVEGPQAVRELLIAGKRKVQEIHIASDMDQADIIDDIVTLARDARVLVREVSKRVLDSESGTEAAQGVIARTAELQPVELDDLCRTNGPNNAPPFLIALDGVTDPRNLGSVLRTAECAGVTGIVLPRHRAVHITPTVTKTAAGAVEYLPMALVGGLPAAIERMRRLGLWVVGLDMGGETSIFDLKVADGPVCLVLGAEGKGLAKLTRTRCDTIASIPLKGNLESLNVGTAAAVAAFEVTRRRLMATE